MLMAAERIDSFPDMVAMAEEPESESSIDLRYFVLLTEPMGERKAARFLRARGFDPYVPMFNRTMVYHVHSFGRSERRSRIVPWPIFTGYLFLPLNLAWSFGPIEHCPGLRQNAFMRDKNSEDYKVLSPKDLSDIRRVETIANFKDAYKVGDEVVWLDGPFAERLAKIEALDDAERITLLMDIFGRETTIFASASQIAKPE